jgi:hypothetical protein
MGPLQIAEKLAELSFRAEDGDPVAILKVEALKARVTDASPTNVAGREAHEIIDAVYKRNSNGARVAPPWAHKALDWVWDHAGAIWEILH